MEQTLAKKMEDIFFTESTIVEWYTEFVPSQTSEKIDYHSEMYY